MNFFGSPSIDQRFTAPGLNWVHIGRFYVVWQILGILLALLFAHTIGKFILDWALQSKSPNRVYYGALSQAVWPLLAYLGGLWFAVRPIVVGGRSPGTWSALGLRRAEFHWYAVALIGAAAVYGLAKLISTWIGTSTVNSAPSITSEALKGFNPTLISIIVLSLLSTAFGEIVTRGLVLAGLLNTMSKHWAVLLTLVFGLAHSGTMVLVPAQLPAGIFLQLVLCLIAMRSGSVLPGIAAHCALIAAMERFPI
jgi:membrane protease YdiL (CAAX protease family)